MVIHMTRREGRRFVEEALFVEGYEAKENQWDIQKLYGMGFYRGNGGHGRLRSLAKAHSGRIG